MNPSQIWYSWYGTNQDLFFLLYGWGVDLFAGLFPALEHIGDYKHFPYYLAVVIVFAIGHFIYRKLGRLRADGYFLRSQIAWVVAFILGFAFTVGIVALVKEYAAFPRPYYLFPSKVSLLFGAPDAGDALRGFPSGHAAFTAFLIVGIWSRVLNSLKPLLILLLVTMCWFRIAIGAHFPADVVYGATIGLLATGFARKLCCNIFKVWR